MKERLPTSSEREPARERIEEGVWRPASFEAFSDRVATGASTKELERRAPDAPRKARMRVTGDLKRTIQDPEELAAALEKSGSPDSAEVFHGKKVVAGMLLARMLRQLDPEADPRDILKTRLVHGAEIAVVDTEYAAKPKDDLARIEADGMITNLKHQPLMIAAADCAPVIIYDPANEAVGIFHSGYKGTLAQVSRRGIEAMAASYGSRPEDLRAVIGPYADGENYEVGQDVYDRFLHAADGGAARYSADEMEEMFRPDPRNVGKYLFDNGKAIGLELRRAGMAREQVEVSGYSTMRDNDLFSSDRKEGSKDRDSMLVMAVLK